VGSDSDSCRRGRTRIPKRITKLKTRFRTEGLSNEVHSAAGAESGDSIVFRDV
jgi:hypothetical protein